MLKTWRYNSSVYSPGLISGKEIIGKELSSRVSFRCMHIQGPKRLLGRLNWHRREYPDPGNRRSVSRLNWHAGGKLAGTFRSCYDPLLNRCR